MTRHYTHPPSQRWPRIGHRQLRSGGRRLLTVCRGDVALRDRILPYAELLRTDPWGYPLVHHAGAFVVVLGADRRERTLGPSERDNKVYGSSAALPAWVDFMKAVGRVPKGEKPPGVAEVVPPDVITVLVDPATGLLAAGDGILIPHRRGTEPTETAPVPDDGSTLDTVESEF